MSQSLAIAAGSQLAADAGAEVAMAGGNAVDAAIAATIVLMVSEPGVCAPGAGGFLTVRDASGAVVTIDANVAMPGRGAAAERFGRKTHEVSMAYGGGVTTTVGYESIGVPGGFAGLGLAWERWGSAPWRVVVEPAIELARHGFPLSLAAHLYLGYTHESIFGWHPLSRRALHDEHGALLSLGSLVVVPHLADALERLADAGTDDVYAGDLARELAADLDRGGSLVTSEDLSTYAPTTRPAAVLRRGGWTIASNPPPSIGGSTLLAMLSLVDETPEPSALIESQERVLAYRRDHLDEATDLDAATRALLDESVGTWRSSPSTVHTSAVDADGLACAITMSAGYGSGAIAGRTGFWMNNSLGEVELNRQGYHGLPVGDRLPSNMAPTIVSSKDGSVLAIGSPGADRITTALQQVILHTIGGEGLQTAVDRPRLHVVIDAGIVAYEAGVEVPDGHATSRYEGHHMYFGGVGAALLHADGRFSVGADPRRAGGSRIV